MIKWFKNIGPGTLVAAAFIGPGTVTLCILAGVHYGYHLLWAMVLSIVATIILQEMAARLGVITQKGLSETIKNEIKNPVVRKFILVLILIAIVIGNSMYEAGNISGGILGLETLFGAQTFSIANNSVNTFSFIIGILAFVLLYFGNYRIIEKVLVGLVLIMSGSFLITAIVTQPSLREILRGLFIPKTPKGSLLTIIGLVGTTVVPYNLFLHASLVKEKWKNPNEVVFAKKDTIISIALGGLVSLAIIITAAGISSTTIENVADLAQGLEPLFGAFAQYFLAMGLFAAGITSAITAPLAAAYVAKGCLGWEDSLKAKNFRSVWILVLVIGTLFSSINIKPIYVIKIAQMANGLLLPLIAGILLWVMNQEKILGKYKNTKLQNFVGLVILVFSLFLGLKTMLKVFQIL